MSIDTPKSPSNEPLAEQVAVVTGASQGIGRVIALRLARAGAHVVLAARNAPRLEETARMIDAEGGRAVVAPTDVTDPDALDRLASQVRSEMGRLDTLVCNSGIAGPTTELWKMDLEAWDETLRVNLTGTFLCCRALLPLMIEQGRGSVVVIGSMTGKRPLHGRTPYAASKLGLVGLVRTLAWEAGTHGIRVNLISPGATDGPRIEGVVQAQAEASGRSYGEALEDFTSASPLRRLVAPEHVADAVVFLASPAAASVTGEDLNVSGGQAMY